MSRTRSAFLAATGTIPMIGSPSFVGSCSGMRIVSSMYSHRMAIPMPAAILTRAANRRCFPRLGWNGRFGAMALSTTDDWLAPIPSAVVSSFRRVSKASYCDRLVSTWRSRMPYCTLWLRSSISLVLSSEIRSLSEVSLASAARKLVSSASMMRFRSAWISFSVSWDAALYFPHLREFRAIDIKLVLIISIQQEFLLTQLLEVRAIQDHPA